MIHAALWIISTLFVIWFSIVCGTAILAFVVIAWRWILGAVLLIAVVIFVNVNTKEKEKTESPSASVGTHSSETAKATYGKIASVTDDSKSYGLLAQTVKAGLNASSADRAAPEPQFPSIPEKVAWIAEMSSRLSLRMPDREARLEFLKTVYFESKRAGLDPQLVLGLIDVSSGFKKYSVSESGARGYMQVNPFWVKRIGTSESNLFHLRTNLRFGCTILRHYLDIEGSDLFRALARYRHDMDERDSVEITEQDAQFANSVRTQWESQWKWSWSR